MSSTVLPTEQNVSSVWCETQCTPAVAVNRRVFFLFWFEITIPPIHVCSFKTGSSIISLAFFCTHITQERSPTVYANIVLYHILSCDEGLHHTTGQFACIFSTPASSFVGDNFCFERDADCNTEIKMLTIVSQVNLQTDIWNSNFGRYHWKK